MNKSKVIHISTVHYWQDARILDKECMSLAKAGYEVHLFIQHEGDKEVGGVQIEGLPLAGRKLHRLTKVMPAMLRKVLSCDRNAILHLHDPELLLPGLIFKILGFKVVYDVHEDLPKDILHKEWIPTVLRKPLSRIMNAVEFLSTAALDGVITTTPELANRFSHNRQALVRNFPKQALFLKEEPEAAGDYAVYVGDIRDIRGGREMVCAINACRRPLRLKMGGRVYPSSYKQVLIESDTRSRMDLLGWVPHAEIPHLLKKALCGLVVLHPLPGYKVVYSVKMFEYMAAGIPVIASDFPLWRQIIEKAGCGILVDPLRPDAIAKALTYLVEHPDKARAMGEAGRKAVLEYFNWEREERSLYSFYMELADDY